MKRLFAPWRMEYISHIDDGHEGCFLCEARDSRDDEKHLVLWRGKRVFVMLNKYPYAGGHLMVVPYAHVDRLPALPAPALTEMMTLAQEAQVVVDDAMHPHGFNIGMNQGVAAGAGIADHLHLHVVPRWTGDTNFMPVMGDVRVMPQHLDETYALLRQGFAA